MRCQRSRLEKVVATVAKVVAAATEVVTAVAVKVVPAATEVFFVAVKSWR